MIILVQDYEYKVTNDLQEKTAITPSFTCHPLSSMRLFRSNIF